MTTGVRAVGVTTADGDVHHEGPVAQPFALASVTKVLVSMAIWVAVEEGSVSLDDPVGPPGSTLRHLLAHSSGLVFDGDRVAAAPGRRRIYSNRGIELAADHLAAGAGMDWRQYVHEAVAQPLELQSLSLVGTAAGGAVDSVVDLLRIGRELLRPTLVSAEMHREATSVVFPGLDGLLPGFGRQRPNDWGLGVEIKGTKSPHWTAPDGAPSTFGHFGQSGSFLWVDPEAGLACAFLGERAFGPWAVDEWPALSADLLHRFAEA